MPTPDPIATYGAQVMPKGYRMSGDVRTGLSATVPYLLAWDNAFAFVNAMILPVNAVRIGTITFNYPYRLPSAVAATPLYAQTFEIEPCGIDPTMGVATVLPNKGLAAGEYFSHAIIKIGFEQVRWSFDPLTEDPQGLNQLDPANPITFCEQSVKLGGKMVTRKGRNYVYASDSTPVVGDVGVLVPEAKLVLKFPRVPYLPWQLLVPYVGKTNSAAVLGCAVGTLLLESPDTSSKQALNSVTPIEQAVTLEFAYDPGGWNNLPRPDGTTDAVQLKGDSTKGIYLTADFRQIFNSLSFSGS